MTTVERDVLIVGAGPAGLASAIELKRHGVQRVTVVDREPEPGGMPRLCHHTGFGLYDMHRILSGPQYARRYVSVARALGVEIRTNTTITGWDSERALMFTSPEGTGVVAARAILLATGVRERPRSARLVPGTRPHGVLTTGALQRFVYEHHLPVGTRALIVGAEAVSLSAFMTLQSAGVKVVAMVTELPQHQIYFPYSLARWALMNVLHSTPLYTSTRVTRILGHRRVEGVEVENLRNGHRTVIPCDTVVFTGDWIPENEVARSGELVIDPGTLGPQVDGGFHTSRRGIFAAGNLLHGAETASRSALEGRAAAQHIRLFLEKGIWPEARVPVRSRPPIRWIFPNSITSLAGGFPTPRFAFWLQAFVDKGTVRIRQGRRMLYTHSFRRLQPNRVYHFSGEWVLRVDLGGAPVEVWIDG